MSILQLMVGTNSEILENTHGNGAWLSPQPTRNHPYDTKLALVLHRVYTEFTQRLHTIYTEITHSLHTTYTQFMWTLEVSHKGQSVDRADTG
jgi:hypothetical protein